MYSHQDKGKEKIKETGKNSDQHLPSFKIDASDIKLGKILSTKGGTAVVYLGTYQQIEVVIKKLKNTQEETLILFEREAELMQGLHHLNVVSFYGSYGDHIDYSIVMEYMPGGTLEDFLRRPGPLSWNKLYPIAIDITAGMKYLHKKGIIHRDLKSSNILLDEAGRVKIADFGISQLKSERSTFGDHDDRGTHRWMAPELCYANDCALILMSSPSYPKKLFRLPTGSSNAAYIIVGNKLMYVDKSTYTTTQIEMDYLTFNKLKEGLEIKESELILNSKGSRFLKKLSEKQLEMITSLTGHRHRPIKNSKASDVYSYGVVLWELSERKQPFQGLSLPAIANHLVSQKRRGESISEETPSAMKLLIEKCWERSPQARPSMTNVHRFLQANVRNFTPLFLVTNNEPILQAELLNSDFVGEDNPSALVSEPIQSELSGKKQLGWNCFDLAVDMKDRAVFVKYALEHAEEEEYRLLLAPEIRHAAALTAIYMNIKAEEEQAEKERIERIVELFHIAEAIRGLEEEKLVNDEIIAVLKSEVGDGDSLRLHALPSIMHTEELREILNDYLEAHEAMREPVATCNQSLGKKEGEYFSLEELDQFFADEDNQRRYQDAYNKFARARRLKLEPHGKELDRYCQNKDIYKQYVSEYYGKQGWFAFQRGFKGEQPATSMIDIAAKYLTKEIIIQQKNNEQQGEVYRTKACGEAITIEYQNNNHFVRLYFANLNTVDKEYGLNNFPNYDIAVSKILAAIGQENNDSKPLGDIDITRGEVSDAISSENNYYTADFINLLLYHFKQEADSIKAYPATTIDQIKEYFEKICSQDKYYAFIPLNVAFDKESPQHKNHWAALIIDKRHQLIFYLDPAKTAKTVIPTQIEDLRTALTYQNEIIMNSIDFQQKEKQEGWIRHCGAYVVEIFNVFLKSIQDGKCISGGQLANIDIDGESISLQTALSAISCGEAEAVLKIRKNHIKDACKILKVDLSKPVPKDTEPVPKDFSAMTLHEAAQKGDLEAVRWLTGKGASLSERNRYGYTALLLAAFDGHLKIIQYLLDKGASASEKITEPSFLISFVRHIAGVGAVGVGAVGGAIAGVVACDDADAAVAAAVAGAIGAAVGVSAAVVGDVDVGRTALHLASSKGHVEVVKWLVVNGGVSVDEKDNSGKTALDLARKPEVKEFLRNYKLAQASNNSSTLFGNPQPKPGANQNKDFNFKYN